MSAAAFEDHRIDGNKVTPMNLISGYEEAKESIEGAVLIFTEAPYFAALGIAPKGILLYGPPGTGKSLLAMSVAALSNKCAAFKLSATFLHVGQRMRNIPREYAEAARKNAPAFIIIDDIEVLLTHPAAKAFLEGATERNNVCVIATTSLSWQIPSALTRLFEEKIHLGLPSTSVRLDMIKQSLQLAHHKLEDIDMVALAEDCEVFTGHAVVGTIKAAI